MQRSCLYQRVSADGVISDQPGVAENGVVASLTWTLQDFWDGSRVGPEPPVIKTEAMAPFVIGSSASGT